MKNALALTGTAVTRTPSPAERIFDFELNDRGRTETTGNDYWKSPVEVLYERSGAKATWKNKAESETR